MAQYGVAYRGKRIEVETRVEPRSGDVQCRVSIDGQACPTLRGNPFGSELGAQKAGAGFGRAMVDAMLDGDTVERHGYFIRPVSTQQRDGSWMGGYQFHRNDNPVPFRRVTCDDFHGNNSIEAEAHALAIAIVALDADIAAGRLKD